MIDDYIHDFTHMFYLEPNFIKYLLKDIKVPSEDILNKQRKDIVKKYLDTVENFVGVESANIETLIDAIMILSKRFVMGPNSIAAVNGDLAMKMFFNNDEIILTINYDNAIHRHIRMQYNDNVLAITISMANYINGKMSELFEQIGATYHYLDSKETQIYKDDLLMGIISDHEESDEYGNTISSYHHNIDFVGSDNLANYYVRENKGEGLDSVVVNNGKEIPIPEVILMQELVDENNFIFDNDYLPITKNEAKVLKKIALDHIAKDDYCYADTINKVLRRNESFSIVLQK